MNSVQLNASGVLDFFRRFARCARIIPMNKMVAAKKGENNEEKTPIIKTGLYLDLSARGEERADFSS